MNEWLYNLKFGFPICNMRAVNTGSVNFTVLSNSTSCAQHTRGQRIPNIGVWSREGFPAGPSKENKWLMPPKTLSSPKGFSSVFKGKLREGHGWLLQTSWCRNPLFFQLPHRSRSRCSCELSARQMLCPVLQLFIYEGKSVMLLKTRGLRMGCPVYFRL